MAPMALAWRMVLKRPIAWEPMGWIFFTERALVDDGAALEQPYPVVMAGDYLSYGKVIW